LKKTFLGFGVVVIHISVIDAVGFALHDAQPIAAATDFAETAARNAVAARQCGKAVNIRSVAGFSVIEGWSLSENDFPVIQLLYWENQIPISAPDNISVVYVKLFEFFLF
jgi:hypothetical protein